MARIKHAFQTPGSALVEFDHGGFVDVDRTVIIGPSGFARMWRVYVDTQLSPALFSSRDDAAAYAAQAVLAHC